MLTDANGKERNGIEVKHLFGMRLVSDRTVDLSLGWLTEPLSERMKFPPEIEKRAITVRDLMLAGF